MGIRFSTYATIWIKGTLSNSHTLNSKSSSRAREREGWKRFQRIRRNNVDRVRGRDRKPSRYEGRRCDYVPTENEASQVRPESRLRISTANTRWERQCRGWGPAFTGYGQEHASRCRP